MELALGMMWTILTQICIFVKLETLSQTFSEAFLLMVSKVEYNGLSFFLFGLLLWMGKPFSVGFLILLYQVCPCCSLNKN